MLSPQAHLELSGQAVNTRVNKKFNLYICIYVFIYFIVVALALEREREISLSLLLLLSTAIRVVFPKVLLLLFWPGQCDYEAVCIDCFGYGSDSAVTLLSGCTL